MRLFGCAFIPIRLTCHIKQYIFNKYVSYLSSERIHKTGVDGTILTEAKYINLSLHFLEQVRVEITKNN